MNILGINNMTLPESRSRLTQIDYLCKPGRADIHNATSLPSPKVIGLLVPEKKIWGITVYVHGGHFGHMTINICYKFTSLNIKKSPYEI